ncbi:MAG: hypothetical protein AAFY71_13560 [Bacteroidota bacterium]
MRYILLCLLLASLQAWSQNNVSSTYGFVHTPKGRLHMLVIFVRYTNADLMPGQPAWPNVTKEGELPVFATGNCNRLFDSDPSCLDRPDHQHNLTEYFYVNSGGTYMVTADIYPVQVPVTYLSPKGSNYYSSYMQMNQEAVNWIKENDPDFDWSKYDQRTNKPRFRSDNSKSEPDGLLDYVMFNHRAPGSNGFGNPGNLKVPDTKLIINTGHTACTNYADPKHNWLYITHEMAHNFYRCPHQMGANTADGDKYYVQKGWGMMAAWHAPFATANAWEAWWLGWIEAREIKENGVYKLKDYLTDRDVIRIPIPGSKDYLWIENHQKKNFWDNKLFYQDSAKLQPDVEEGLYMYVVSGMSNDRNKPYLSPFEVRHVNSIRMYNGEGNYDYVSTDATKMGWRVFRKEKINPFAGQNDFQFIKADLDKSGSICAPFMHGNNDGKSCDQIDMWAEEIEGDYVLTYGNTGNGGDALNEGDEVGLSGLFPITNYPSYQPKRDSLGAYLVNGISIKVLRRFRDGSYELDVKFDNWKVRNEQRWCGTLKLIESDDPLGKEYLEVMPKGKINMELSGTPNRSAIHPQTGTFAAPTQLVLPSGRGLKVHKKATLTLDKNSIIRLKGNSELVLMKGSTLDLQGKIILEGKSRLIIQKGAKVKLTSGSLIYRDKKQLVGNAIPKILKQNYHD